jgi:flagellar FliL protein
VFESKEFQVRILLLMLGFLFFSGFVYAGDDEAEEPIIEYLEMKPKFTVNLAERKKYLQINVQLMVEGTEAVEKIKKHFPALRHQLIMLFSGRFAAELQSTEQREKLRQEALDTVRESLDEYTKTEGLKDLFFTEFLVN